VRAVKNLPEGRVPQADRGAFDRTQLYNDRAIFTDIDHNLLGDPTAIARFGSVMREHRARVAFGIATSRTLRRAVQFLREQRLPPPDVLITSLGADIHYAPRFTPDRAWRRHIDHLWKPQAIRRVLAEVPGLELQPRFDQDSYKISYLVDPELAPDHEEIIRLLRQHDQRVNAYLSGECFLDVVPIRVSKGLAIRYVADQWEIPLERVLAAGGSGSDEDMMRGNTLAVVVANRHEEELSQLVDVDRVYFSRRSHADGILEAIDYYDFFGRCEAPAICKASSS
jgi:sucrose-phosphate synthase